MLNPNLSRTTPPPVMEARRWIAGKSFPEAKPLLNLSQAAPVDPPPDALCAAMAEHLKSNASAHLYGPVLGLPGLRAHLAATWQASYGGTIASENVAITSGCNQAFAAAIATLAAAGDNVILPTPWYFNHKMWLDMSGIEALPFETGPDLLPDPAKAAALITPRTKAIALVSPNNPCGVEYPKALLQDFLELARAKGIALILDETYRDFHSSEGAPHDLFQDPYWDDTLIHLYSFSKAYRLTGHRVGALLTSPQRLAEVEKWLDTVAICPNQLGQFAALWGMQHLDDWLAGERLEILARRDAMVKGFAALPGWDLLGCGAYFAYTAYPFSERSDAVAKRLVDEAHLLTLPGTMFGPLQNEGGTGRAESTLRIAFANASLSGIETLFARLAALSPAA